MPASSPIEEPMVATHSLMATSETGGGISLDLFIFLALPAVPRGRAEYGRRGEYATFWSCSSNESRFTNGILNCRGRHRKWQPFVDIRHGGRIRRALLGQPTRPGKSINIERNAPASLIRRHQAVCSDHWLFDRAGCRHLSRCLQEAAAAHLTIRQSNQVLEEWSKLEG